MWDDEERDDVMSLDMTDRVMGYQSFQRASTPANVSSNVWTNGRRKGRKALGSSRPFRPHHSVCQVLAPVGFQAWLPHPCHSAAAMHAPTACVSLGPSTAQGLLWRACGSWFTSAATQGLILGDLESSLQLLAEQDEKNANDWVARLIRMELRGVEQGGRGRNSQWLIPASGMTEPVKIIFQLYWSAPCGDRI